MASIIFWMMNFRLQITRPQKKVIGQFQYDESKLIGKGTNSVVYQGVNMINGERVCVKQIRVKNSMIERGIINQVQILQKMKHPNIIKYISHNFQGSFAYIITQLCDESLSSKIHKFGKMRQEQAILLFLQILEGYLEMRRHSYLHRDLKPENILIRKGKIKIIDFGCSLKARRQITTQKMNIGTPLYMSPETLKRNVYSQKSQIWTLGVILYEMLQGVSPFTSKRQQDLFQEMKLPIKKISCSQRLWFIIDSCLEYEASMRFNLLSLYQNVNLLVFEMKNGTKKTQSVEGQIQSMITLNNECNYIKFLQYVLKLIPIARLNQEEERLNYLIEFNIRMRLDLLQRSIKARQINEVLQKDITLKVSNFHVNHQFELNFPSAIAQNDRLNFFTQSQIKFKQSLQWQTQAELKQIILRLYADEDNISSEEQVLRRDEKLKLLDFLLTVFLLNKTLIQCGNDMDTFERRGSLKVILSRPTRIDLSVYRAIQDKMKELKMI